MLCAPAIVKGATTTSAALENQTRWSEQRADKWGAEQGWIVGCNFIPSTAVNQLEMWQEETFDLPTIDRELGYAHGLGFNAARVFLQDLLWKNDPDGLLSRMESFLRIADKHGIKVMFVIFDGVWNPFPHSGKQPAPVPHVMGSGWVQSPGAEILKDPKKQDELRPYVEGIIGHFKNDDRVLAWDVFNEPDNPVPQYSSVELADKATRSLELIDKAFSWAREVGPTQPLTSGVWNGDWSSTKTLSAMERFQLDHSDVISFHSYAPLDAVKMKVEQLKRYNRPLLCTEYMARPLGSTFNPVLGYFKKENVGAFNWGLVLGKTQTAYPWDSWEKHYDKIPKVWFHDIFWKDGRPFDSAEADYIRKLTGVKK